MIASATLDGSTASALETAVKFKLRLYVTGATPTAQRALENLSAICSRELRGQYELEVIDVLEQPEMAQAEKILATPTLLRRLPEPVRRIIGDLSDRERVLFGLRLEPLQKRTVE